ncbi:hypothetical protein MPH_14067, partial [Macrophomina phaseolina MS6]
MGTPPETRETVFCHECQKEWYRDQHGLTCPYCNSEFTEILEPDQEARGDKKNLRDVPNSTKGVPAASPFGNSTRLQRNVPNSYSTTSTRSTSFGGTHGDNHVHNNHGDANVVSNPLFRNFVTMIRSITGGGLRTPPGEQQQHGRGHGQLGPSAREETSSGSGP